MQRGLRRNELNKRSNTVKRGSALERAETGTSGDSLYGYDRRDPAWEVVKTLVNGGTDPSRLLELYYWTREPGIVELIRAYLDLPPTTQRSLGNFLLNTKPQSVTAVFDAQGRLVLSQPLAPAAGTKSRTANRTVRAPTDPASRP